MDSSEASVPGIEAAVAPAPERALTQPVADVLRDWVALAVALVVPWWLPWLAIAMPTFYKEWLFALALGFAGLIAKPFASPAGSREPPNPLALAALAAVPVLLLQIAFFDGVWRRATLMILCAAFFVFAIAMSRRLRERSELSLVWIAKCLLVAALGSCLLAAAQLLAPGLPFVLPRTGPRLYANVAQANHFCDLLWLGSVAAVFLRARGALGTKTALALVVVLQVFATTSGSRMAWIYGLGLGLLGAACWLRTRAIEARRLAGGLMALVLVAAVVTGAVAASGVLEAFGLTSAEQRASGQASVESNAQRLWFWRVGLGAAVDHPLLGVGAGRFAGEGLALAMQSADAPHAAADVQAHNIFIQLAAECGIPVALAALLGLVVWLTRAWRDSTRGGDNVAVIAMALPILVHANLEHPLGYLYFLGLLGLLVGQVRAEPSAATATRLPRAPAELIRYASFAVLVVAGLAYVQFMPVERATQSVSAQVRAGATPQPTRELEARLAAVPPWSIFGDYAELIALINARPTLADAADWAKRCERSLAIGPSPHLLARCATILQIAGQAQRASYFANSLCKIYPESAPVLIQSMTFLEQTSPAVENLGSMCVQRAN